MTIADGTFDLSTGDDGVHADGTLAISGGTIAVKTSYEGLEGSNVTISAGDIQVNASDDGLNAAGGSDSDAGNGWRGPDSFQTGGSHASRFPAAPWSSTQEATGSIPTGP